MKRILLSLLLLSMSLPVYAVDGNKLLDYCKKNIETQDNGTNTAANLILAGGCVMYIKPAFETHDAYVGWGRMKPAYCRPEGVPPAQLVRIVVKHLEYFPELLHTSAASLVNNAFMGAFPCN